MSEIAIRAEKLSKLYQISASRKRYGSLREHIVEALTSLPRRRWAPAKQNMFCALQDASFEVKRGEVVGIVGRNGAGKSTLLKILARITEPTTGSAELHGRVGSLLEVGTGFHQELTGRENVYLNGAILGMRKSEIERKFDQIVAFSETDQFIDTPVKHYSTGMQMRLAFAVAAHLEPEILIIDEVLAVGDLSFQNKCLGRMQDVASEGRTVLFVSHNMGAVANLCTSGLWLDHGTVRARGRVEEVVAAYIESVAAPRENDPSRWRHQGTGEARFIDARLVDTRATRGRRSAWERHSSWNSTWSSPGHSIRSPWPSPSTAPTPACRCSTSSTPIREPRSPTSPRASTRSRSRSPSACCTPVRTRSLSASAVPANILDHVQDVLSFSMVPSGCSKRTTPFYPQVGVYHAPSIWREA